VAPRIRVAVSLLLATCAASSGLLPDPASASTTAPSVVVARQHTMIVHARGPLMSWQATAIAGAAVHARAGLLAGRGVGTIAGDILEAFPAAMEVPA
jgi:NAD(P)H-hydrate repair Nnr-like enzyme with NAD(P)H-hydrate dehydratase domain